MVDADEGDVAGAEEVRTKQKQSEMLCMRGAYVSQPGVGDSG